MPKKYVGCKRAPLLPELSNLVYCDVPPNVDENVTITALIQALVAKTI